MLFPGNSGFGLPSSANAGGGFNPAAQAPWRTIPWAPEAMPTGTPIPVMNQFGIPAESYLPAGVSSDIPGFDPLVPGGNLYPTTVPASAAAPAVTAAFGIPNLGFTTERVVGPVDTGPTVTTQVVPTSQEAQRNAAQILSNIAAGNIVVPNYSGPVGPV